MYTLNLLDIRAEVRGKVHHSTLTDATLTRWVNITQDYIWTHADLKSAEYVTTFNCVANREIYYIDANVGRIKSLVNTTNQWPFAESSDREMSEIDPSRAQTGTPERYAVFGKSEVSTQNPAASQYRIVSSSIADTTQSVRMIGLVSGVERAENLGLVGQAQQTSTLTYDANGALGIRLTAICAGNITVTDTAAPANTLVIIPPGKLFKMYQPIRLQPIPSGTDTIRISYIQGPRPLVADYDIPDLPHEYHHLVVMGTIAQAHDEVYEFDIAERIYAKLDKEIDNLRRKDSATRGTQRTVKVSGIRNYQAIWGRYPVRVVGD